MFCPKCGSLMHPKDGKWVCSNCGYEMVIEEEQKKKEIVAEAKEKEMIVISSEEELKTLPLDESVICPKCGHAGAHWMLQQTRGADEPETRFYICPKCGHRWREY